MSKSEPRTGQPEATLEELALYLQRRLDQERARLADELHDTLGGLLVAVKIDLGHLDGGLGAERSDLRARLVQMRENLDAAIATERALVEQLQPGLLTHIGLFAALRWYADDLALRDGTLCQVALPDDEPSLPLAARVAWYRAAQEALSLGKGSGKRSIQLRASVTGTALELHIVHPGPALPPQEQALRLLAVRQRLAALGGWLSVHEDDGRLQLTLKASA